MAPSYLEEELLKRRVQSCNNQSCSQQARLSFIHSLPRYMHAVSRTRSASTLRARLPRLKKEGRTKLDLALNRRPASERVGVMKAQSAATLDTVLNGVVATNYLSPVRVIEDLVAQERESDAVILGRLILDLGISVSILKVDFTLILICLNCWTIDF